MMRIVWLTAILTASPAWAADVSALPAAPAALRPAAPIEDINRAAVFTIHEVLSSPDDVAMAERAGADVWIRAWFKWREARDYEKRAWQVTAAHKAGARFGGGVTCSALYDGENGLTDARVRDMATRGPDGALVNAWGKPGIRHGSLSNPAYRNYVLSWCYKQIDHGVDYLFMDEITAALGPNEGFDEYALRDFRRFLVDRYIEGQGWSADDARWHNTLKVDTADRGLCPDGTVRSFDYRAYLKRHELVGRPHGNANPLARDWQRFRQQRDDRVWKAMVEALHRYAASKGRRVWISGNGLAKYVDLQVLGVWGRWRVDAGGRIDLSASQLADWWATVRAGRAMAGRRVPVVLFHDWGMHGYPWMRVTAAERVAWMRIRGAEIYAAGGRFAFPIRGPWGKNALQDGILDAIVGQIGFYRRHRHLYLNGDVMGTEPLDANEPMLSLALWRSADPARLVLHVINRKTDAHWAPVKRTNVAVTVPTRSRPERVRIVSPDWDGDRAGRAEVVDGRLMVTLPEVHAYAVAVLAYAEPPAVHLANPRVRTTGRWAAPEQNTFQVQADGTVSGGDALNGYLQGRLHAHLQNPPTFLANMPRGGRMRFHVMGVSSAGARVHVLLDGQPVRTLDLPDRDHRNDAHAAEYDQTFTVTVPPGSHRVGLRNDGPDWAFVTWYAFDEVSG